MFYFYLFFLYRPLSPAIHPSLCFSIIILFVFPFLLFHPPLLSVSFSFLPFLPLPAYKWIYGELRGNIPLQYLAWVSYPLIFILFSSLFCHLVAPQAIGLYALLSHSCVLMLLFAHLPLVSDRIPLNY